MQEDSEEMLEDAVGLINLDSDLQTSWASTISASPPDSDSDCDSDRSLF